MKILMDFTRIQTTSNLEALSQYQRTMESQFDSAKQQAESELNTWLKDSGEAAFDEGWPVEIDEYRQTYEFTFPLFLRYSFLVLLFFSLENELNRVCDEIAKRRSLALRVKDIRASGTIATFRTYLQKVAGLSGLGPTHWEPIMELADLRNCIVHALGKIPSGNEGERLRQIVKKTRSLSISDGDSGQPDVLLITPEYCAQAVAIVDKFFDTLFEAADFGPKHIEISE